MTHGQMDRAIFDNRQEPAANNNEKRGQPTMVGESIGP